MRLSDTIEQFIKTMLTHDENEIELKRNELAEYFNCAPSQINYVLATRFTPEHGYLIQSRRGGGGYIRIFHMHQDTCEQLVYLLEESVGDHITALKADHLITQLRERNVLSPMEAGVMMAAIAETSYTFPIHSAIKDALRAKILKAMLLQIARKSEVSQGG